MKIVDLWLHQNKAIACILDILVSITQMSVNTSHKCLVSLFRIFCELKAGLIEILVKTLTD